MTRRSPGARAGGSANLLGVAGCAAFLAVAAVACTDPRARPVGPSLQITLTPRTVVASPGTLTGSLDVSDANGLDSVGVRVELGNGSTVSDSTFFPTGSDPFSLTLPLLFQVPDGIPQRTAVRIVARARSYLGFVAADTALTAVGDTI